MSVFRPPNPPVLRGKCGASPRRGVRTFSALVLLITGLSCAAASQEASAQKSLYSCKDDKGRTLTSDRPIPECMGAVRELRSDGSTRREIPAPLNAEQRKAKEREDEILRIEEAKRRDQLLRDKALLAAYADLDALEVARRRQIAEIERDIEGAKKRMEYLYQDLQNAQVEARARPNGLTKQKVQQIAYQILAENDAVKAKYDDIEKVKLKFDGEAKRLAQLLAPATAPTPAQGVSAKTGKNS